MLYPRLYLPLLILVCHFLPLAGQDAKTEPASTDANQQEKVAKDDPLNEILAGHSYHGDAFNEGPRQAAYLMGGTGKIVFPVTTKHPQVRKFIEQGIGQLHGFWDLEAERTFRHAAALDPDCAMAYWGAALATKRNAKRARGFIDEAVKRKKGITPREQKYIDALNAYLPPAPPKSPKETDAKKTKTTAASKTKNGSTKSKAADDKDARKKRAENYARALEEIALAYPDDLEAKAFLALQLYENRRAGIPLQSYLAADGLMEQIFRVEPMHPTHHFRIHLWDLKKPENALKSAALCGQSAPKIAHMWHMPGHIFSRLKRYEDAVWQQEASARVDHAHMMRDRVLPDEIHNFAHNNEWMIRNLIHIGAVQKAIDLAKNMAELPRHPKYNTLSKRGSTRYGRERLFQTLRQFEVWDQTISLCRSVYLEPTDEPREQRNRLRALGIALVMTGKDSEAAKVLDEIRERVAQGKSAADKEIKKAVQDAKAAFDKKWNSNPKNRKASAEDRKAALEKELEKVRKTAEKKSRIRYASDEKIITAIEGFQACKKGDFKTALTKLKQAGGEDETLLAEIQFLSGEKKKALEALNKSVERRKNEVIPLARLAYLLDRDGQDELASKTFEKLRETSGSIDLRFEFFSRLNPLAAKCGYGEDWVKPQQLADDIGKRPDLDDLGPLHWSPPQAPSFELARPDGSPVRLSDFKGRPVVVIFYLGASCLHCAEQLQAFAPQKRNFEAAGIDMIAISTDDQKTLIESIENYGEKMPIPLISNHDLTVFKKFRAFDDFEKQPLHGTFLIDENGLVRWQDISYEPFMDHKFLLTESIRLLNQKNVQHVKVSDSTPSAAD